MACGRASRQSIWIDLPLKRKDAGQLAGILAAHSFIRGGMRFHRHTADHPRPQVPPGAQLVEVERVDGEALPALLVAKVEILRRTCRPPQAGQFT